MSGLRIVLFKRVGTRNYVHFMETVRGAKNLHLFKGCFRLLLLLGTCDLFLIFEFDYLINNFTGLSIHSMHNGTPKRFI